MGDMKIKSDCPFCNLDSRRELIVESPDAYSIYDRFPVSNGHALIIPKRHCSDYFELTIEEQTACWSMVNAVREILLQKYDPDGFNVGINVNEPAGQTIPHVHIHLIPRYIGDVNDPEGGVRGVIPQKRKYLNKRIIGKPKIQHSINQPGSIPKKVPKEAREMSEFFSLVIDETMERMPSTLTSTGIRCFKKRCTGIISSQVDLDNSEIYWKCSICRNSGTITGWQKTE
jgi:diadenosine tetraphosphate (Ap4A) HIT family hydrolase